jgi:hypothetical protein
MSSKRQIAPVDHYGSWEDMLVAVPVKNIEADAKRDEAKRIRVSVRTIKPRYMIPPLTWIIPYSKSRTAILDKLGTEIWDLCDGKRSVERVTELFAERHRLTFHEARVSVTEYIKMLVQRGALAILTESGEGQKTGQ